VGRRRGVVAVALLCAALLSFAGAAGAAPVPVSDVVARPMATGAPCATGVAASTQAGAYRDLCLSFSFDTSQDDVKGTTIHLPAGVVGDPTATSTRCAQATFEAGGCAAAQQVGTVSSEVTATIGAAPPLFPGVPTNMTVTGEVYNLQPAAGEPARLGIALDQGLAGGMSPVYLPVPIRVRVSDAGLDSVTDNIPNTALGGPLHVRSMALTMWGPHSGRMDKPFMSMPSRCDVDAITRVTVTSYGGQTTEGEASFRPTGCEALPFDPSFVASSEVGKDVPFDTPGEASAELIVPPAPTADDQLHQAYLKDVELRLPPGLALNPPIANGLVPCTPEQFAKTVDATPTCPANTEMGRVEFKTPLFPGDTLTGKVYFGQPRPGIPLVNYISVEDPRLRLKLEGYATIDHDTTAITAHFEDQPQVPFTSFKFIYTNNPKGHATLTAPVGCGKYDVTAAMTPWGGGAPKAPTDFFNVVADDGTMNCLPEPFTPSISAAVSNPQAGADTALTVHIERPDRQQRLQGMTVSLPAGLTGRLPAVPACPVADARASNCADASQVGTAKVAVGTGPTPLELPGKVFLTQGFDGGIAGLAVQVDTKLPAIDLGKVVVLNKIVVRPDTGLDVITEPLPQTLEGIPTVYRSIELTIDKPGFMRNATSCAQLIVRGAFSAVGGAAAAGDGPYQATGCEKLPFDPELTAKIGTKGQTGVNSHPPLTVTIQQADGEAAMSKTVVTLPAGIGVDIKNLGGLCTGVQLDAGQCPANSRIGDVSADTPLLPTKLSGGVYLLKPDKPGLPGLALDLGLVRLRGTVAINGRLTTTFASVPDVPLRRLVLNLTGGPKGSLLTTSDLCKVAPTIDAQYGSHSGAARTAKVPADVEGCADQAMSRGIRVSGSLTGVKKKRPTVKLKVTSPTALKQVSVKLPSALKVRSGKALKKASRLLLGGRRQKGASVRLSGGKVVFKAPKGKSARTFAITLPRTAIKLRRKLKVGSTATFTVAATPSKGRPVTIRVKLKARK
jgi:LysM repeat protein